MLIPAIFLAVLLALAGVLAWRFAARRLSSVGRESYYAAKLKLIHVHAQSCVFSTRDGLHAEDEWLLTQLVGNLAYYLSERGMATTIHDLHRLAADQSRERELFLRRFVRALRNTRYHWLVSLFRDLTHLVHDLAVENTVLSEAHGTRTVEAHQRHKEVGARVLIPAGMMPAAA